MRVVACLIALAASTAGCGDLDTPQDRIVGHWEIRQSNTVCADSLAASAVSLVQPVLTSVPFCPRSDSYAPGRGSQIWITEADAAGKGLLRNTSQSWDYSFYEASAHSLVSVLTDEWGGHQYYWFAPSADGDSLKIRRYIDPEDRDLRSAPYAGLPSSDLIWETMDLVYVDRSTAPEQASASE
jgi:hypothetical protein